MKLLVSRRAERHLRAIGDWIAIDDPARAASYTRELLDACERLLIFPRRFPLIRPGSDVHKQTYGNYLILYSVDDAAETVTVAAIERAARDLSGLY